MKASDFKKFNRLALNIMRKPIIPILDYLLISEGYLIAFNISTLYRIPVNVKGEFLIPFSQFKSITSILQAEDEVDFKHINDHDQSFSIFINGEKRYSFEVKESVMYYPQYQERIGYDYVDYANVSESEATKIRSLLKFVSRDELRPAMCSVCFGENKAVATDGHKLVYHELENSGMASSFLMNREALSLFVGETNLSYSKENNYVMFRPNDGLLGEVFHRCGDERFPNWQAVVPLHTKSVSLSRNEFLNEVRLAMISANAWTHQVIITIENGHVYVTSTDLDFFMSYKGKLMKLTSPSVDTFRFGMNGKFLLDVLRFIDSDTLSISFDEPNKAILFNNSSLIMPVMISDYSTIS